MYVNYGYGSGHYEHLLTMSTADVNCHVPAGALVPFDAYVILFV